jgi:aryl-alcohol dehydrogenase-like predicted oxidoreductase
MTFGVEAEEAEAHRQLDRFLEAGGTLVDTATGRPAVSSTILGTRNTEQLEANLRAADLHLTPQETADLDAVSDPGAPDYPYGEMGAEQRRRRLAGGR